MTKLKMMENSSQNSSPDKLTQHSTPVGMSLETMEEGCAKNQLVECTKFQNDYQTHLTDDMD